MSEEDTKDLDADSTNPLPFEEFVRRHLALLIKQGNELREQQAKLQEQHVKLQEEMIERFVQLSRQIRDLDVRTGKIEEFVKDIDYKLDDFIKEQIRIKREWREFQEEERRTA